MTSSVSDAEDIAQEAFLRATKTTKTAKPQSPRGRRQPATPRLTWPPSPPAWPSTTCARPGSGGSPTSVRGSPSRLLDDGGGTGAEPPLADGAPGPAELAETSDSLSMAFLVLLESLSPPERAVFLLREVFGYGYPEIAEVTGKTEPACRQIFARPAAASTRPAEVPDYLGG